MRFTRFFPALFTLGLCISLCFNAPTARAQDVDSAFKTGIVAFQKGDFNAARTAFQDALKHDPSSEALLYNLGLTEHRLGQAGLAIALWRKALALHPGDTRVALALVWAKGKLDHPEIPHEVELTENLRDSALVPISIDKYLLTFSLLLFVSGFLTLRYFGARRRALLDEKPLPSFPAAAVVAGLLALALGFLSGAKIIDDLQPRATVIVKKVDARSTPDETGTSLFELFEGLEVIPRHAQGDWIQVTYPGGATGWVPRASVFATTDSAAS